MANQLSNYAKVIFLYLMCVINLLYMHYYIISTCGVELGIDITSFYDNFCAVIFDVSLLFATLCIITRNHVRTSLGLCFGITLCWSFCNILYSRFFFRYISFSSLSQTSNLLDWFMLKCMINEIHWQDFLFIVFILVFCLTYSKTSPKFRFRRTDYFKSSLIFIAVILTNLVFHLAFCIVNPQLRYFSYYTHRLHLTHMDSMRNYSLPNWTNYHRGSIRTFCTDMMQSLSGDISLTAKQGQEIIDEMADMANKHTQHEVNPNIKNVIFILVESYTAFTTDMTIDGREVTPFLNRLKHSPDAYYNGSMKSNITIGQSSDGQYIYMAGLLPLRSMITVSVAKKKELPALPKVMKQFNPSMEMRMVIPTLPSLWEQDAMCQAYGFDALYSSNDYTSHHDRYLTDEQLFELAKQIDLKSEKPFFSCLITMSMHGPYTSQIDSTFIIQSKKFCPELVNFLNACHYTDRQIEKYIMHLKKNGLYDNSLIIIAPDHQVPEVSVNTEQYGITRELPLFIINGNINNETAWKGECNQIDVFTTILDVLNIDSRWRGLGHTLLSSTYENSLSAHKWDLSDHILLSNFFATNSFKMK